MKYRENITKFILQVAAQQQNWKASVWDIFQSTLATGIVSLNFFALSVAHKQEYNTSMRKQPHV